MTNNNVQNTTGMKQMTNQPTPKTYPASSGLEPPTWGDGGAFLRLFVRRIYGNENYTEGKLDIEVNGVLVKDLCDTLEPTVRDKKIFGTTAIPDGTYKIKMSPSMKFRKDMPFLIDVPNFKGVMIHPGNAVKDTQGCILVGIKSSNGLLEQSRKTFDIIYNQILVAIRNGQETEITITNGKEIKKW